jgi:hypothetical protein
MPMMRNKAKAGIDRAARGARKATETAAEISDRDKTPSARAGTKVRAVVERAGDKLKEAGRSLKSAGRRTQSRAKTRATRSRSTQNF